MADGNLKPCENQVRISKASAAAKPVDKLCEALLANDLSDYINSISYPYDLCHSADDEVVVSQWWFSVIYYFGAASRSLTSLSFSILSR